MSTTASLCAMSARTQERGVRRARLNFGGLVALIAPDQKAICNSI